MTQVPTVAQIETIAFRLPMLGELRWGKSSSLSEVRHVAVRVTLSDGASGMAEAPPRPTIYGETVSSIKGIIAEELAPRILGLSVVDQEPSSASTPFASRALRQVNTRLAQIPNNHAAKGALDMALHAAVAQHQGLSLVDYAGAGKAEIRVSYILGIGDRDAVLAEARRVVDQGVRVLKVKVGRNWEADVAHIVELRTELGPTVDLYADANECMDAHDAAAKLDRLRDLGLLYCEEPLPVEQIRERAELRAAQHLPIIADDSTFSLRDLRRELALDTFDILNIKTARTGYTESAAMLDLVRPAGKGVMVGSQASAGLGTACAAVFAARPDVDHPCELSFFLKLQEDLLSPPLRLHDGYLRLADVAAAQVDADRLREFALP